MKISIRAKEGLKIPIVLFLPLWGLKLKVVSKALNKYNVSISTEEFHNEIKKAYKIIKQCVKENGHFDLVNVKAHDGTRVRIRV